MLGDLAQALFDGLSWATATFLVAFGLTLAFGVMHILNLAQHRWPRVFGAYAGVARVVSLGAVYDATERLVAAVAAGSCGDEPLSGHRDVPG